MYETELFEIEDGYGFNILRDGVIEIHQEFKPGASGFIRMSRTEAEQEAQEIIGRLTNGN